MTAVLTPAHVSPALVRTDTGVGLHLADCPHIRGSDVHLVTSEELAAIPVCRWSRAELEGAGRTHFENLDEALHALGMYSAAKRRRVRGLSREVVYDKVWMPHSGSYVTLGLSGVGVAWVGKTYVELYDGRLVPLVGYTSARREPDQYGAPCPSCWQTLPLTGDCDNCGITG